MTDEIQSFQGACLHRDRRGEGRNIVYPVTVWVVGVDNSIVALQSQLTMHPLMEGAMKRAKYV